MEACLNGHLDVAELLIRKANARNERRALLVACRRGQSKIAKLLIKAGANINRADEVAIVFVRCIVFQFKCNF